MSCMIRVQNTTNSDACQWEINRSIGKHAKFKNAIQIQPHNFLSNLQNGIQQFVFS